MPKDRYNDLFLADQGPRTATGRNILNKVSSYLVPSFLTLGIISIFLMTASTPSFAGEEITVYKSPACDCCKKWMNHLKKNGFKVKAYDVKDVRPIKRRSGVRPEQASCHTALIGDYVIEGHVPAKDIKRLLKEKPKIKGLTVPGMVVGSPGMEGPRKDPYKVLTITESGPGKVYAEY